MAKFSPLVVAPPLLFAGLAVLFYVGMFRDDPQGLPSTRVGNPAPGLALTELGQGPAPSDADLRQGDVTLVNYWASWCGPCRAEHPYLELLTAEGHRIIGVNYKDSAPNALGFLDELGDPFALLGADADGRTALDWGLYGVPETYVVAGDGTVMLRFAGPITAEVLETRIRPAIAEAQQR